MKENVFARSVTLRSTTPSRMQKRLALKLSVILLASLLVGCAHQSQIQTVGTVRIKQVQCWPKKIRYSKADTAGTVGQVREHNATGHNIGCW